MVRERLSGVIHREPDLCVCGEAEVRAGALEIVERVKPRLGIVDLTLKRSNGLDLIKDLRVMQPDLLIDGGLASPVRTCIVRNRESPPVRVRRVPAMLSLTS